ADQAVRLNAKILELFPFASQGQLFLDWPTELSAETLLEKLPVKPSHMEVLPNLSEKVLESYLSLRSPPLQEDLLVIECDFLGRALKISTKAGSLGLEILDIRFMRDSSGQSFVFLTGASESCEKFAKSDFLKPDKIQHIKNPTQGLRNFFPRA